MNNMNSIKFMDSIPLMPINIELNKSSDKLKAADESAVFFIILKGDE